MMKEFDHILDTEGLFCPEPVMMLHKAIRDARSGELLKVVASDPSTERDIPKFCQFLGHELVESGKDESGFYYFIRKS